MPVVVKIAQLKFKQIPPIISVFRSDEIPVLFLNRLNISTFFKLHFFWEFTTEGLAVQKVKHSFLSIFWASM